MQARLPKFFSATDSDIWARLPIHSPVGYFIRALGETSAGNETVVFHNQNVAVDTWSILLPTLLRKVINNMKQRTGIRASTLTE
jgi:hypothetical protein